MEVTRDLMQMKTGSGTNGGSQVGRRVAQEAGETVGTTSVVWGAIKKARLKKSAQSRIMAGVSGRMGRRRQGRAGGKTDEK